jgi:RND family efflux transporter MFP subunit
MSLYSQDLYQAEQDFMIARDSYRRSDSADSALTEMRRQLYEAARQRLSLLGLSDGDLDDVEKSELPSPQMMLRSPFSGYVLEKSVYSGQYLSPDQNLLTIADLSTVWVLGDVYEKDIPYVHEGQSARMRLTAIPGEEFQGTIGYLYPSISEKTRTMKVRLQFSDPRMRFRPGMYAEVQVQRETNQALVVPADAVMDGGSVQYAFVVHNGTHFEPRLIKVGSSSDDWVQVLSGLNEGEEVVTSANFLIDSESRLKAAVAGMGAMPGMESMSGTDLSAPKKQVH